MFGKWTLVAVFVFLIADIHNAHAAARHADGVSIADLDLLCLGQDHRLVPSRSMHIGCLIAQPLPAVRGGQRLRTGTVPVWYPRGTVAGATYSLDLSWAIRAKGNVYFWLKAEYAPARTAGADTYTTRISEAMFNCAKGNVVELKSWNYDLAGKASVAKVQQGPLADLPERTVSTLRDQCTVEAQAY